MATAEVGALRFTFTANTAELQTAFSKAEALMARFEKQATATANAITKRLVGVLAIDQVVSGFIDGIARVVSEAEQLRRLSESTGVGVEVLSRLKFAAQEMGVPFQTLEKVVEQFGKRLVDFAANPTSAGAAALAAMGVSARNAMGELKSFEELLPELADKFASYRDGANKSALASALFGEEAGPKMARLLSQGSAGLARLGDEGKRLGVVVDQETAAKLKVLERASRDLHNAFDGLATKIAIALTPAFQTLSRVLSEMANGLPRVADFPADKLNERLVKLTQNAERLRSKIADSVLPRAFSVEDQTQLRRTEEQIELIQELIRQRSRLAEVPPASGGFQTEVTPPDLAAQMEAQRAAVEAERQEQRRIEAETRERLNELIRENNQLGEEAARIIESQMGPNERLMEQLDRITQMERNRWLTSEQAAQAAVNANLQAAGSYLDMAGKAAGALSQLFSKNKALAIATAAINTAEGITKALTLPFPLNWAQAAAVAAAGAAQVAAIRSAREGSGTTSGVRGGGSRTTASPQPAAAAQPVSRSLIIEGIGPSQLFTGEAVRGLVEQINAFVKDGGVLIATATSR